MLAPVHQPLHLIAVAVANPIKGRRPATTGTTTGPVGPLVVTLRDRVPDMASTQRGPVGPAGIGLVPGQMIWSHPGPATAAGPGHPHLVEQSDQLAGVGVLPGGEPGGQIPAPAVADAVHLGGQPTA